MVANVAGVSPENDKGFLSSIIKNQARCVDSDECRIWKLHVLDSTCMFELFSDECLHQRAHRSDTMGRPLEKLRAGPLAATIVSDSIFCGPFATFLL